MYTPVYVHIYKLFLNHLRVICKHHPSTPILQYFSYKDRLSHNYSVTIKLRGFIWKCYLIFQFLTLLKMLFWGKKPQILSGSCYSLVSFIWHSSSASVFHNIELEANS